jgi:hypothetical protein
MGLGIRTASRRALRSTLFALGYHAVEKSDSADILALIWKLKPLDCGIDLIRVGSVYDGGYLIPDDLEGIEYCFSPGVSTTVDFEAHLADRHIRSFLADYSVENPPVARPEFTFDKKFLGAFDQDPFFTLATWKNKYLKDYRGDMVLQMDIEGAEYEVILSTPDSLLDQFRIIVVEFHALDRLFDAFTLRLISSCFEKLLRSFCVVHIHPNDCSEVVRCREIEIPVHMEFTFLNKKRVRKSAPQTVFPHKLDARNTPDGKALTLAKIWYS